MGEDIRRVAGTVLRAPFTRRTVRELLYCGLGGLAGVIFGLLCGYAVAALVVGAWALTRRDA